MKNEDGSLKVTIYRKPTHTDQYLNFSSNHPIQHKRSVVNTLLHRAEHVITDEEDREEEKKYVREALAKCGYPKWMLDRKTGDQEASNSSRSEEKDTTRKCMVTLPYVRGLSEQLARTFGKYGCRVVHKPQNTLRQLLVAPKDPAKKEESTGVVYRITCEGSGENTPCEASYIGETARSLKARAAEHRRPSTTTS